MDQRPEVVIGQDHSSRLLGDLAAASHRDADVGLLERRSVVDSVTSHRNDQSLLLHNSREAQLVLRRHTPKNMELRKALTQLAIGQRSQLCPADRTWPQTERLSNSPSRYRVVAGDHPDIDPSRQRRSYGPFGLGSQGVNDPSHPDEGEVA